MKTFGFGLSNLSQQNIHTHCTTYNLTGREITLRSMLAAPYISKHHRCTRNGTARVVYDEDSKIGKEKRWSEISGK